MRDALDHAMDSETFDEAGYLRSGLASEELDQIFGAEPIDHELTSDNDFTKPEVVAREEVDSLVTAAVFGSWFREFVQCTDASLWAVD